MANLVESIIIVALGIIGFAVAGVMAIQNDKTHSKSFRDDGILSASTFTGQERTDPIAIPHGRLSNLPRTLAAFQLESSKNVDSLNVEGTRSVSIGASHVEPIDALISSENVDQIDGNNIEAKPGEYFRSVTPTNSENISGEEQGALQERGHLSEPQKLIGPHSQQSQYPRAMHQQRQSRQEIPRIYSEHAPPPPPALQTASLGHRQANPDIQDIITGIVKLLNGNVNVAGNTARPLRPIQATRINNRGPPRISDVPPLPPDFDTPGMNPPPPPNHPYPFEKPPAPDRPLINQLPLERPIRPFINGVPVPEQIVPQGNRPWNRPYRPSGTRRPISPYKPLPPLDSTSFHDKEPTDMEKHSEKVTKPHYVFKPEVLTEEHNAGNKAELEQNNQQDSTSKRPEIFTGNESEKETAKIPDELILQEADRSNVTFVNRPNYEGTMKKPQKYQSPLKEDKVTAENTLILGSELQSFPIMMNEEKLPDGINRDSVMHSSKSAISLDGNVEITKTVGPSTQAGPTKGTIVRKEELHEENEDAIPPLTPETISKIMSQTTLNVETNSMVRVIESTPVTTEIQPTIISLDRDEEKLSSTTKVLIESSKAESIENMEIKSSSSVHTEALPSLIETTKVAGKTVSHSSSSATPIATFSKTSDYYPYRPRPGIVLDDTLDYAGSSGLITQRPFVSSKYPQIGDIFDITVSAIQGPGGGSPGGVRVPVNAGGSDVILTSAVEGQGFVSIDGKRTYLNLFDNTDQPSETIQTQPQPTRTQSPPIVGTGFAVPQPDSPTVSTHPNGPIRRPTFHRRPAHPPVRIDTCIVGDTSTCDASQHEACATVQEVSACHCKPGYARLQHSLPCKKIISILVSMRVDKAYDRKIVWDQGLSDKDSESFQTLAYEANRAIESAMSMTPFSDEYMGSLVNSVYQGDVSQGQGGVFVNATLKLIYEPRTARPALAGELQRHLLGVIHRRNNNIGNSALYVDSPPGSISNLQDLDECASSELNDCHSSASCLNIWGSFTCTCNSGFKDPHKDDPNETGRTCLSCPSTHCNNRGICSYQGDQMQCTCTGNYYGAQCEVDGEVLGVAIGASVAALIIIVLTLVCLVIWSRRWSREQKAVGSPVYGYMQGGIPGTLPGTLARVGSVGTLASVKQGPPANLPSYMWAHIADHMATANLYAAEPMGSTRPSSAMFGYPAMNIHGTIPPVPLPRLQAPPRPGLRQRSQPEPDSSDSEPQDKDRADLIPQTGGFHVPRPKSRSSLANQSGIYYDVEYDQGDSQHLSKNNIPMSTYSMARPYYRT